MSEVNDRLSMLRRCRVRYQEIIASREDMGLKRARSDADITMILAELALTLPDNERVLVQEMITLHNQLWSLDAPFYRKRDEEQQVHRISLRLVQLQERMAAIGRPYQLGDPAALSEMEELQKEYTRLYQAEKAIEYRGQLRGGEL